mgnify:CR=1 FL=1
MSSENNKEKIEKFISEDECLKNIIRLEKIERGNDKELNKDIYFEDRVLNGGKLIFSENPYKEENVSGLERYYCYDIKNKRLEELNIGNKYMACFYENHEKYMDLQIVLKI